MARTTLLPSIQVNTSLMSAAGSPRTLGESWWSADSAGVEYPLTTAAPASEAIAAIASVLRIGQAPPGGETKRLRYSHAEGFAPKNVPGTSGRQFFMQADGPRRSHP